MSYSKPNKIFPVGTLLMLHADLVGMISEVIKDDVLNIFYRVEWYGPHAEYYNHVLTHKEATTCFNRKKRYVQIPTRHTR